MKAQRVHSTASASVSNKESSFSCIFEINLDNKVMKGAHYSTIYEITRHSF